MSLGLQEAARRRGMRAEPILAVDSDKEVIEIFKRNFPDATTEVVDVSVLFDGEIGGPATATEEALAKALGPVSVLQSGPPCQGLSASRWNRQTERPTSSPPAAASSGSRQSAELPPHRARRSRGIAGRLPQARRPNLA